MLRSHCCSYVLSQSRVQLLKTCHELDEGCPFFGFVEPTPRHQGEPGEEKQRRRGKLYTGNSILSIPMFIIRLKESYGNDFNKIDSLCLISLA